MRGVLVVRALGLLAGQTELVPLAGGEVARTYPGAADLVPPVAVLAELLILRAEVV